jgi:hypothetical protein
MPGRALGEVDSKVGGAFWARHFDRETWSSAGRRGAGRDWEGFGDGRGPDSGENLAENIPLSGTPLCGKIVQIPVKTGLSQHIFVSSDYENLAR